VKLSKKYPFIEEESDEVQNYGLEKLQFLKSLSSKKIIDVYSDLMRVILLSFCVIPKCTSCPENNCHNEECGHDRKTTYNLSVNF
jgi:hypothetical protein